MFSQLCHPTTTSLKPLAQASREDRFNRRAKTIFKPAQPSDERLHTLSAAIVVFAGGEVPVEDRAVAIPTQLAALCDMWHLGRPIDVIAFFDRSDVPVDAKDRVRQAGIAVDESDEARGAAYREMQAQIILEVAKLDKQRWNPLAAGKGD